KAESMLDSVVNDIGDFPDLVERAADYRDNIAIGRLLVKANGLRDGGDLVAAIQTYESVLARDPNNATAKEELKAAREKASASNLAGTLSLTGNKNGTVFIDGEEKGTLPASFDLQPGVYEVAVQAEGYQPWSRKIEVTAAGTHSLDAT